MIARTPTLPSLSYSPAQSGVEVYLAINLRTRSSSRAQDFAPHGVCSTKLESGASEFGASSQENARRNELINTEVRFYDDKGLVPQGICYVVVRLAEKITAASPKIDTKLPGPLKEAMLSGQMGPVIANAKVCNSTNIYTTPDAKSVPSSSNPSKHESTIYTVFFRDGLDRPPTLNQAIWISDNVDEYIAEIQLTDPPR